MSESFTAIGRGSSEM